jgi:hypothetical protein
VSPQAPEELGESFLERVLVDEQFLEQRHMLDVFGDAQNALVGHSVAANGEGSQLRRAYKPLCDLGSAHGSKSAVIDEQHLKRRGVLEVDEQRLCAEGIDCVVADVQPQEAASHQPAADKLDRLGDFLLEAGHEDVVNVQVLSRGRATLMFLVCLRMPPKASQNCSEYELPSMRMAWTSS